jgi:hypothetical protein
MRSSGLSSRRPGWFSLSLFEKVSVFLKAPQVRLEQVKRSLSIPRIDARSPQTDYAAFLLLYDATPFGDEFLGAAKIIFGIHLSKQRARGETGAGLVFVRHPHQLRAAPAGVEVRGGPCARICC